MNYPDLPQYILWKTIDGAKVPVDAYGAKIDPHNQAQWLHIDDAMRIAEERKLNVGFVLTREDPYFVLDIDKCRDPITGEYTQLSKDWHNRLPGCPMEISVSGTGVHMWGRTDSRLTDTYMNKADGIEIYTHSRFIALGTAMTGSPDAPAAAVEPEQWATWLKPRPTETASSLPAEGPVPEYTGPQDDATLIQMMLQARPSAGAAFGSKASLKDLWTGNVEVLSKVMPAYGDDAFDRSSADAALCAHLAFWTGKDAARMERLWLQSPLAASRDDQKKLKRADYRRDTVVGAAQKVQQVYSKPAPPAMEIAAVLPGMDAPVSAGETIVGEFLTIRDQIKHFDGCVYIGGENAILTPRFGVLNKEPFSAMYGGHEFQMQADGSRPTRDAWDAFTVNRAHEFPKVMSRRYWPDKPFGHVDGDEVNAFRMPDVVMSDGDVTPFLDLLERMLPDDRDRKILLSWMAALVQKRGTKFQWAVVLQGTQGNGKTFMLKSLEKAIGPSVCHQPNPEDMHEKYNSYLEGHLLIGVEEIHMAGRREMLDRLKKYITNDRIEVRQMRRDKRMVDNLTNWMFLTNYQDAVLKSKDDRRYAIFFTAQQKADDLKRDGMDGDYFAKLWTWANNGGFEAVAGFLMRYEIPSEFNPADGCHRAPETSSALEAIAESLGPIEQTLREAIEQEVPGFCGGWISSVRAKDRLTDEGYFRVSPNVLKRALSNLGYEPCKSWKGGRASSPIDREGNTRPVLYVTAEVNYSAQSIEDYKKAQGYSTGNKPRGGIPE